MVLSQPETPPCSNVVTVTFCSSHPSLFWLLLPQETQSLFLLHFPWPSFSPAQQTRCVLKDSWGLCTSEETFLLEETLGC